MCKSIAGSHSDPHFPWRNAAHTRTNDQMNVNTQRQQRNQYFSINMLLLLVLLPPFVVVVVVTRVFADRNFIHFYFAFGVLCRSNVG